VTPLEQLATWAPVVAAVIAGIFAASFFDNAAKQYIEEKEKCTGRGGTYIQSQCVKIIPL